MTILDKDSKFFGAFTEACDLLQLNRHVLSGGNHNPTMVKRFNRYLNKGLKVMSNERGSIPVAMEAILPHKTDKSFWQIKRILQYRFTLTAEFLLYLTLTNLPIIFITVQ